MRAVFRSAGAFAVKDLLQARRETRAWYTALLAFASMATFALLSSGPRQRLVALQLLYLSPAIVVGTFFTRCIEDEVRVFLLLRQVFSSTRAFLRVKLLMMIALSAPLLWTMSALVTMWGLRAETAMLPARIVIVTAGAALQCTICLGLAASFARLDEPQTTRNAAAPMVVQGGYWISAMPIAAFQWALELLLGGAPRAAPAPLLFAGAVLLGGAATSVAILLLITGTRRLSAVE